MPVTHNYSQTFEQFSKTFQQHTNERLKHWLPDINKSPIQLHKAMHYSALSGGKRLRPLLVYTTGECFGAAIENLDVPAVAIELIHCYSLIHDDLPAMDNDDLRRGQPTCHKVYGEATAILVGDALQSLAFYLLACQQNQLQPYYQLQMIETLAHTIGSDGMAGGQQMDLHAEGKKLPAAEIEKIYSMKTAALIRASIRLGALAAECEDFHTLQILDQFANDLGLAFQIQDDILDIEGDTQLIGKQSGADAVLEKATYPASTSIAEAKRRIEYLKHNARQSRFLRCLS